MKVLSLFDGISCARVALERAGFTVEEYRASEIDKYAIQISKKNYPDIEHVGSVAEIHYRDWNKGYYDLLIGGSPCQDLSIAKKDRKGLDGDRSSLFWEYVRILKETKPKYFILENVASMSKDARAIITETLGVEPIMIDAALVSAQRRKRLFWTNIPNVTQPEDRGILLKDILESGNTDRLKSYCIDASYYKGANWKQYVEKGRRQLVRVGSLNKGGQGDRIYSPEGKSVGLSALGGGREAKTGLYKIDAVASRTFPRYKEEGESQEKQLEIREDGKANAMTSVQSDSMVAVNFQVRKLTPVECERLQGLKDNYTEGISNTQRYKCLGNAFNVDVVAHILSFIK